MHKTRRPIAVTIICWLLVLACMIFIFSMSAQIASDSSRTSGRTIRWILKTFVKDFESFTQDKQAQMIEDLQFIARKTAHFSIYALLGVLLAQAYLCHSDRAWTVIPASVLSAALYAATDELHQRFVAGRSGEVRDIFIDTCGALLGLLLSFGITKLLSKIRSKKRVNNTK